MKTRSWRVDITGPRWKMQSWDINGDDVQCRDTFTGSGDLPEWVRDIVSIAKAGGNSIEFDLPPPSCALWFVTDEHNNFIKFDNPKGTT